MSEFVNRMALQREILRIVNAQPWEESLFGLSQSAIARWQSQNRIPANAITLEFVTTAARALRFLATMSQDQISRDYEKVCDQARAAMEALRLHFANGIIADLR